ncbi:MAG: hypothetical protein ACI9K3_001169 [Halovenus sp.]|jgi:hypothetical protein
MDITPRLVATLSFVALLPFGAFALWSGEMTPVIAVVTVVDTVLVAVSIVIMFGPVGDSDHATTQTG